MTTSEPNSSMENKIVHELNSIGTGCKVVVEVEAYMLKLNIVKEIIKLTCKEILNVSLFLSLFTQRGR